MPLEIVWTPLSRARLQEIHSFIALDKPEAAQRMTARIVALVDALREHPYLGRAGAKPGIRELVVGGSPYIVIYKVQRKRIVINTIWHGAQRKRSAGR